ncbi:hypothetical protein yinte0001_36930 [Yersinia intermedia ATCC 29909]|nr:hypothetical protein yinte0001_36930 [Yersinia intermedia ATCC 29909]
MIKTINNTHMKYWTGMYFPYIRLCLQYYCLPRQDYLSLTLSSLK